MKIDSSVASLIKNGQGVTELAYHLVKFCDLGTKETSTVPCWWLLSTTKMFSLTFFNLLINLYALKFLANIFLEEGSFKTLLFLIVSVIS